MFNFNSMSVLLITVIVLSIFCQATRDFTSTEQRKLLKFVNIFRKNVANCQYPAENMQEVFWDDKLVEMAQTDVANCKVISSHSSEVSGVAIFLQNYSRIEDLIGYVRNDPVSRPYLVKATFYSMGCAMNSTSCPEGYEVVCYWYPQCGSLYNAFEEGELACEEYGSKNSKSYKGLCLMPRDELTEIDEGNNKSVCAHKTRKKATNVSNDQKSKEEPDKKLENITAAKFIRFF